MTAWEQFLLDTLGSQKAVDDFKNWMLQGIICMLDTPEAKKSIIDTVRQEAAKRGKLLF